MPNVADNQNAMKLKDRWARGVNYTRYLRLRNASGELVDLSQWDGLELAVQGPNEAPITAAFSASYDASRGGAAQAAITIFIEKSAFEVGWKEGSKKNVLTWALKGIESGTPNDRPIFAATLTIFDTAFEG